MSAQGLMKQQVCNRCGQASPVRPPAVGDIIMGPLGTYVATISEVGAEDLDASFCA